MEIFLKQLPSLPELFNSSYGKSPALDDSAASSGLRETVPLPQARDDLKGWGRLRYCPPHTEEPPAAEFLSS